MKLTQRQQNILEAAATLTIKTKGKNYGEVKGRTGLTSFDGRSVNALERKGLLNYRFDGIHGAGYAVSPKGAEFLKQKRIKKNGY